MDKCGFILSTLWLGWSGRGSCFSGGGETSCNFGLAGLGPAFLSPVRTRTWGLLPSTLPCSVGGGGPPTQAEPKSELGPHSSPPFLSAGPVEAKQVLPGHNSSVSCKKKKTCFRQQLGLGDALLSFLLPQVSVWHFHG